MTTADAAPTPLPTAQDLLIASLRRQRAQAEDVQAALSAQLLALQRERDELAAKLAEVTAEAAKPQKKDKADG